MTRTAKVDSKLFPWIDESSEVAKTWRFSGVLTDKDVRPTFLLTTDKDDADDKSRLKAISVDS